MRLLFVYLALNWFFLAQAFPQAHPDTSFTTKDMWGLSRKVTKSLRKCKPLRKKHDVIVEVENATTEFVNRTQFADLIHSMLEGETHAKPETTEPEYEIRARLEFQNSLNSKVDYVLTAQVFQAEEKLCEKKVKISKNSRKKNRKNKIEAN